MLDLRKDELSNKDNYCIHGNFTGSSYGEGYLCGLCEDGTDRYMPVFQNPVVVETPWSIFWETLWETVPGSGLFDRLDYVRIQIMGIRFRKPWTWVWTR